MTVTSSLSTERDRSKIPPQYTWDLGPVYSGFDAWKAAKDRLLADVDWALLLDEGIPSPFPRLWLPLVSQGRP